MCAEASAEVSSDGLKKAMRKYEKKLRQIRHLEEQSSSRELTKEEIEKVSKKGNRPQPQSETKLLAQLKIHYRYLLALMTR